MFLSSRIRLSRGVLAAMLPGSLACAPGSTVRRAEPDPSAVRVVVENAEWHDMNVYLESAAGSRFRIGTVNGFATRTLAVKALPVAGPWFRLVGDPIGSEGLHVSEPVSLVSGMTAHWRVGQTAATSSLSVY